MYLADLGGTRHVFADLKALLAAATPLRSGDQLAGVAAGSAEERVAARYALADLPLKTFLNDLVIPYEKDEVTRLIIDSHDAEVFSTISHLTVGGFREWLLSNGTDGARLAAIWPGDGGGGLQADAQSRSDRRRAKNEGALSVSQQPRPAGAFGRAAAAQSSHRRS
jgi:ethanolamine ammonia-lyase large subunit